MDDVGDLDVENLFTEDDLNQAALESTLLPTDGEILPNANPAPTPGLVDRSLELSNCGCLNRIAWSRQGYLAKIVNDGDGVEIQCLRLNCKTSKWELSKPKPVESMFENATTLIWNPTGVDLAVVDSKGRVAIFSVTMTCLNNMNEARSSHQDQPEELGQCIGAFWLNPERKDRPKNVVQRMLKANGRWSLEMGKGKAWAPLYPRALFTVSRAGKSSLLFQRPDLRWSRASAHLPVPSTSVFTHAAIARTTDGKLLVFLHEDGGVLSEYRVDIVWPPDLNTNLGSDALPTLNIESISRYIPALPSFAEPAGTLLRQGQPIDMWLLSQLEILPTSDIETAEKHPPTVIAVYTSYHHGASIADHGFLQTSVIRRWQVEEAQTKLHPRFDDILPKTKGSSLEQQKTVTKRLPDVVSAQIITSIQILDGGSLMAVITQDGKVETWDLSSMLPTVPEPGKQDLTSIFQAGYAFPSVPLSTWQCLSPNATAVFGVQVGEKNVFTNMTFVNLPQNEEDSRRVFDESNSADDAGIASIVLAFLRSCWSNTTGDDVVSAAVSIVSPRSLPSLFSLLYKTSFNSVEFISEKAQGSELERVVQKPIVGKVLSFHLALLNPWAEAGSPELKAARLWAWLSLSLRYITTMFYIFYSAGSQGTPLAPGYVSMICGNIRWSFAVFHFIIQAIIDVGDRKTNPSMFGPLSANDSLGDEKGDGSQGVVALLLNINWSRSFLVSIVKALRAFGNKASQDPNSSATPAQRHVYETIAKCSSKQGVKLSAMDKVLDSRWYADTPTDGHNENPSEVAARQIEMMATGVVSLKYTETLGKILDECINGSGGIREKGEIDRTRMLSEMPDRGFVFLNMDDIVGRKHSADSQSYERRNKGIDGSKHRPRKVYDCHKKTAVFEEVTPEALSDQLVRRCVRCGSLSEDLQGVDRSWPRSMITFFGRCVCDGVWITEALNEGNEF